jgi:hypothetical protein
MRLMMTVAVATMGLALAGCGEKAVEADVQATEAPTAEPAAAGPAQLTPVTLIPRPELAPDAEALPRLSGDSPAIVRINAELDRMDAAARAEMAECGGGEWERWVTQPMTGPGYLTLRVHTSISCGGPYPSNNQVVITWDLATGQRLDWTRTLPGLSLTADTLDEAPQDYVPNVSSATLAAWYSRKMLAGADREMLQECADVWSTQALNGTSFKIWLDAESSGVVVEPDFPHVIQACAEPATLTVAELQGYGAPQRLLDAVVVATGGGQA